MPTNYSIGTAFNVVISVTVNSNVSAYAVEDRVPFGWTVSSVSHEGRFCRETAKVRWGVFLDNSPRQLSYSITPSATNAPYAAEFAGAVSFDGFNTPITGKRRTYRATTVPPSRWESVKTMSDGNRLLTFVGDPGVGYTLEASTNLLDWEPLDALLNNDGALQYIDLATNNVFRFYRAVPNQ